MRVSRRSAVLVLAAVAAGVLALAFARSRGAAPRYVTADVDRGDLAEVVGATGTLQAVTTVQVGSQVSGTILTLEADFNSNVRRGQVVARLDPSLFEARLGQARANLAAARANAERARTTLEDARQKYRRAQALSAEQLLPESELETARATYEGAASQVKASDAAVTQAEANVNQAEVDLTHTVIRAPIDGIVVARNVDVGQTVAASLQAPTLFVIANDLSHMQVLASVDEADVGRIRPGQAVTFRVDAYPERTFEGRVEQVRLQPTVVQNVVTYRAIIGVENPGQTLMPGMTATVTVVTRERRDVLRLPAAALRFRPEGWEARTSTDGGASLPGRAEAATGGGVRRRQPEAGASPAPRDATGARGEGAREGRPPRAAGADAGEGRRERRGTEGERRGRPVLVFVLGADGRPEPREVRLGLSDGQLVEVTDGLEEGAAVVVGAGVEGEGSRGSRPDGSPSTNPFAPQRPQRRQR